MAGYIFSMWLPILLRLLAQPETRVPYIIAFFFPLLCLNDTKQTTCELCQPKPSLPASGAPFFLNNVMNYWYDWIQSGSVDNLLAKVLCHSCLPLNLYALPPINFSLFDFNSQAGQISLFNHKPLKNVLNSIFFSFMKQYLMTVENWQSKSCKPPPLPSHSSTTNGWHVQTTC